MLKAARLKKTHKGLRIEIIADFSRNNASQKKNGDTSLKY